MKARSVILATAFLGATIFTATAGNTLLGDIAAAAQKNLKSYDNADNLCKDINGEVAAAFKQAGIAREIKGVFNGDKIECVVYLGSARVGTYPGEYFGSLTGEQVAENILEQLTHEEVVKIGETLPKLLAH